LASLISHSLQRGGRKPRPRYGRIDGKPPLRPRGRHAKPRSENDTEDTTERKVVTVPVNRRLGFRVGEFASLLGVSYTTIWRHIRDQKIETVVVGGVRLIPWSYAVQRGLITSDDNV
jgi:excisionase family DNA binding protein